MVSKSEAEQTIQPKSLVWKLVSLFRFTFYLAAYLSTLKKAHLEKLNEEFPRDHPPLFVFLVRVKEVKRQPSPHAVLLQAQLGGVVYWLHPLACLGKSE